MGSDVIGHSMFPEEIHRHKSILGHKEALPTSPSMCHVMNRSQELYQSLSFSLFLERVD